MLLAKKRMIWKKTRNYNTNFLFTVTWPFHQLHSFSLLSGGILSIEVSFPR